MMDIEYQETLKKHLKEHTEYQFKKKEHMLSPEELVDNEDELIRILHKKFLDGEYA